MSRFSAHRQLVLTQHAARSNDNVTRALAASSALSTLGNTGSPDSSLVREQRRALESVRAIVEALSAVGGAADDSDDDE